MIILITNFYFLDHQQNYESDTILEYKEQLRDFQIELTRKSQEIERLVQNNEITKKQNQEELEKLLLKITEIKSEHADEMQELDNKWKEIVKQKTSQLENKYEQDMNELSNEWHNERKVRYHFYNKTCRNYFFFCLLLF